MTMIKVNSFDSMPFDAIKETRDGYIVTMPKVARTGIQLYAPSDLGLSGKDPLRVWRPEDEVFKSDSLASYAHRPITIGHPPNGVNPQNWSDVAVGVTGEDVMRDGEFVRVPILLMDAKGKAALELGIKEISMGYSCNVELVDGVTPSGEAYNAIQRDLRMNHLAIVPAARGGSELKVGDGETPMTDPVKTKVVLVDGLQVETTEAGAAAIEKLQAKIRDSEAEIAKRDDTIGKLEKQVLSDAEMTARVENRARVVATAKFLDPNIVCDGKTDAEIRRAIVSAKYPMMDSKSDDYIQARFDLMLEDMNAGKSDPLRNAIKGGLKTTNPVNNTADEAYKALLDEFTNAWKNPGVQAKGH